ncbi:MAG: anthranilate synthase component I [Clostridiales bacterium]|jgi:anthranilate synthase component 1|nr:anthranilate synthase component I [Clostridiales bacterium]
MEVYPTLNEVKALAREYRLVPVMTREMADMTTPVNVFLNASRFGEYCFLLESAEKAADAGKFSFVGFDPETVLTYRNGEMTIKTRDGQTTAKEAAPFERVNEFMAARTMPLIPQMPKFAGGFAGYFGYDTARYSEPSVKDVPEDDLGLPEIVLMDCRRIIAFEHYKERVTLITHVCADGDVEENYAAAVKVLEEMAETARKAYPSREETASGAYETTSATDRETFLGNVEKAKEYIRNGDIFQVVISRRLDIANAPDPFKVYRSLRASEPSPYMYYFALGDTVVVGSSPEKLVSVENGLVTTNPIAGTIRRGATEAEDAELERTLLNDEKERAEHVMLVDLSRNDIGKICEFETVVVDKFMEIGRFSRLMHIVSQVSGTLRKDFGLIDVLRAVLPAGTLSGAPKIRAMQIIDELESAKRGLYGGAIGYIGFNGVMDACIAIRTAVFKGGGAYVQAGAGIVADSVPDKEYLECQNKMSAMLMAFEKAVELK